MKQTLCAMLLIIFALTPSFAFAWSEAGHHLIALMAFRLLSPQEQAKLVTILEKHPRYQQDFKPPQGLPGEDAIRDWRIGRAGYWPDLARRQSKYHRPTWHYELGASLVIGDSAKLKPPERPGPLPQTAKMNSQELYISQAFELCQKTLADVRQSDEDRAIALCWVAHLVADAHQPCHAGSLYMEGVFTQPDGDRGGNRIPLKQSANLHALWDQLLGGRYTRGDINRRMAELALDQKIIAHSKKAAADQESLNFQTWLAESRRHAIENVYQGEVLEPLKIVSRGIAEQPGEIQLSQEYLKNAGQVAQLRAAEASHRLAETWRRSLP